MKDNGKKNLNHLKSFFLPFACLLLLTACWDAREIEQRTAVDAIGVDVAPNGKLDVTVQVPIPLNVAGGIAGGGGGDGKPVKIFSAQGKTLWEALQRIQYKVDYQLFFGQTMLIAYSEKVVRTKSHTIIDALRRQSDFRRHMYPLIVEGGKGADLLKVSTDLEKVPANYLMKSIDNAVRLNLVPDLTLGKDFDRLSNTARQTAMLVVKVTKHNDMAINGMAAFHGDKMVTKLNREEMANFLRISQGVSGGKMTFPFTGKNKLATFSADSANTKDKISFKHGRVYIRVRVNMEGHMEELAFPANIEKPSVRKKLEKKIEKQMSKESEAMIHKLQRHNSDILDFGARIRAFHPEIWKKINWDKAFPNAKVKVDYHVKIRRSGVELKNYNQSNLMPGNRGKRPK